MPFDTLHPQPSDALLSIIEAFANDARQDKIDLGVGVFRDDNGRTPVMAAVKLAEARLLAEQTSKSYLGPEGDRLFVELLQGEVFGETITGERLIGLQTPGGTGALRLGAELLAQADVRRVWLSAPSWVNHAPIFTAAGLEVRVTGGLDLAAQRFDFAAFETGLAQAVPGDAVLLHGCCHNPTGIDPDAGQWHDLAALIASRGLVPIIDLAYHGLGDGLEVDVRGARAVLAASPSGLLAYSCDKNFGLYRDRVGALWAMGEDRAQRDVLRSNLLMLARANWSMPPDHGAAVVRVILKDPSLTAQWQAELDAMRSRLAMLRGELAAAGRAGDLELSPLRSGRGMFSTLAVSPAQVVRLRTQHGIYMAPSGRINIAGFDRAGVARFCEALTAVASLEAA